MAFAFPPPTTPEARERQIRNYWVSRRSGAIDAKEVLISCGILVMAALSCAFLVWVLVEYALATWRAR